MSSPDGEREHLFTDLADRDPELADRLTRQFLAVWLKQAELVPPSPDDALASVELKVGPDECGAEALRLRSFHTGSTYWRYEWDGSESMAAAWIEHIADAQALNVETDRRFGPVPWDARTGRRRSG